MEKVSKLLQTLLDQTEKGSIAWLSTADDEMFQYSLPDGTIRIEHNHGNYYLSILNGEAKVVDYFSDDELDQGSSRPRRHFELMRTLFNLARRKALRAEETLDGLLAQLGAEA